MKIEGRKTKKKEKKRASIHPRNSIDRASVCLSTCLPLRRPRPYTELYLLPKSHMFTFQQNKTKKKEHTRKSTLQAVRTARAKQVRRTGRFQSCDSIGSLQAVLLYHFVVEGISAATGANKCTASLQPLHSVAVVEVICRKL